MGNTKNQIDNGGLGRCDSTVDSGGRDFKHDMGCKGCPLWRSYEIHRIGTRDRQRIRRSGIDLHGFRVHHYAYHSRDDDLGWTTDCTLMTDEEHRKYHQDHPEHPPIIP